MKLWKEEDQGNVNATVVGRCWALSLWVGGRCSTQGRASRVNANANPLKFNFKCSSQKAPGTKTYPGVNVLLCSNRHWMQWMNNKLVMSRTMELISQKGPYVWPGLSTGTWPWSSWHSRACSVHLVFASSCIWLHHIIKIILFTLAVLCIFCLMVWHAV